MTGQNVRLPLWLRAWHWTNAALILTLMATGISMHFAAPGAFLVPFRWARLIHNTAGISLVALYFAFAIANLVSGNWRQYWPSGANYRARAIELMRHYAVGILTEGGHGPWPPRRDNQLNALQQLVYWVVMYVLLPSIVLSGFLFLWPEYAPDQMFGLAGVLVIALFHNVAALAIVLFVILHVYLATTGPRPTSLIRMMITGKPEL